MGQYLKAVFMRLKFEVSTKFVGLEEDKWLLGMLKELEDTLLYELANSSLASVGGAMRKRAERYDLGRRVSRHHGDGGDRRLRLLPVLPRPTLLPFPVVQRGLREGRAARGVRRGRRRRR